MSVEKGHYPVRVLCRTLGVSPSGFYKWTARPGLSARAADDRRLRAQIRAVHVASGGRYGSPRVHEALQQQSIHAGRNRVMRLMRLDGLRGRPCRRRRVTTTIVDPRAAVAPNVLARQFCTARLNDVWVGDITAIPTRAGWLQLAILLDLYSRRVVGWALGSAADTGLTLRAWRMAVVRRGTTPRLHHSDRGRQYTSLQYQQVLAAHGVVCSMSRTGNCYDNAVAESFMRTLKVECVEAHSWLDARDAAPELRAFIDDFYNHRRLHSSLGYRSPVEFERQQVAVA